jgi:predicted alpha/beta superfamily hydrolase
MKWLRNIACCVALLAQWTSARVVDIVVYVPQSTPPDALVYVSGAHESLGNWKPDGLKLQRRDDGSYAASVDLPEGKWIEYKITQGSWETVEKAADGRDRGNRRLFVIPDSKDGIIARVEAWSTMIPTTQPLVIGDLRLHEIESTILGTRRTLRVWLPEGYELQPDRRYPVLYMHDGQNCFDRSTSAVGQEWKIDETLTNLIREGTVEPLIVVGIDNGGSERIRDYTYSASPPNTTRGGNGDRYARFVIGEVIPFIEKNYRARVDRTDRFIGGSSLGGLVSIEIARRHPDVFGGVIAMSPTLLWSESALLNELELDASSLTSTRLWIDMGTREADTEDGVAKLLGSVRRLDVILTKQKIEHELMIAEGARHNEEAWAARFPHAIGYMMKLEKAGK